MAEPLPANAVTAILEHARHELRRLPHATEEEAGHIIYDIARRAYRKGYSDGYDDGNADSREVRRSVTTRPEA